MRAMLAYYVHNISPDLIRFTDRIGVHWYGLCYVLGFYFAYLVMAYLARRGLSEVAEDKIADLITGTAIFGVVIGGRLGYMLGYGFNEFIRTPWIIIRIWDGGMASHGGIIGVALYLLWYARKHNLSWTGIGDTLVCGAPIARTLKMWSSLEKPPAIAMSGTQPPLARRRSTSSFVIACR